MEPQKRWSKVTSLQGTVLLFPGVSQTAVATLYPLPLVNISQINRRVRVLSAPSWWWSYRLTRPRAGKAEPYPAPLGLLASHLARDGARAKGESTTAQLGSKKWISPPEVEKFGGSDYKFLGVFKIWNDPNFGGLASSQRDPLTHDHWHRSCNPLFIGPS